MHQSGGIGFAICDYREWCARDCFRPLRNLRHVRLPCIALFARVPRLFGVARRCSQDLGGGGIYIGETVAPNRSERSDRFITVDNPVLSGPAGAFMLGPSASGSGRVTIIV